MTERERKLSKRMGKIGKIISHLLPKGFGFALLTYEFGTDDEMLYVSNSNQEDVEKAMYAFISQSRKEY